MDTTLEQVIEAPDRPVAAIPVDTDLAPVTYAALIAFYREVVAPRLEDPNSAGTRVSALTRFIGFLGKDENSSVGPELGAHFGRSLASFLKAGEKDGRAAGTLANLKSYLRQWETVWQQYHAVAIAPRFSGLADAIVHYTDAARLSDPSLTDKALSIKLGKNIGFITDFKREGGQQFYNGRGTTPEALTALEVILGVPPTTFTQYLVLRKRVHRVSKTTETGKRMALLVAQPYAMHAYPPQLLAEVRQFIRFKTAVSVAPLKRVSSWRLQPKAKYSGTVSRFEVISLDGKKFSASAESFVLRVSSFFGAMAEMGHAPEKFSLTWLCDHELMLQYVDFMEARLGKITNTVMTLIHAATSLMVEEKGFLPQHLDFANRCFKPIPQDQFVAWIAAERFRHRELAMAYKGGRHIKQGRDVEDAIRNILQRQHPISAVLELIDNMDRYLTDKRDVLPRNEMLSMERDLVIFKIMVEQPLRIKMCRDMTYTPEDTGNLYKRNDGSWAIRFRAEDFKNEQGAAQEGYDVVLSAKTGLAVEAYVKNIRPAFEDTRSLLFVSNPNSRRPADRNTTNLSGMLRFRVQEFLPCCPAGFGPHAIRHIIATDYIKNHPEGFQVAAAVLHDKIETVIKHYSHVKKADTHKHYITYLDALRKTSAAGGL